MMIEARGSHAVHALKRKRAQIAGLIRDHERQARNLRLALAHVDATLKLFDDEADPDAIIPKRVHRRTRYFDGPELARLVLNELRKADGQPITTDALLEAAVAAGNVPDRPHIRVSLRERIIQYLNDKMKAGHILRHGFAHEARWSASPDAQSESPQDE
jgi:hypothetical protein